MRCEVCGREDDRVRGCCDAADAEDLCDGCYQNNKGLRHNVTHNSYRVGYSSRSRMS